MAINLITQPPWRLFRISAPFTLPSATYAVDSAEDGYDVAFIAPGQADDVARANGTLIAAAPALRDACEAVLMFHSGGAWDAARAEEWLALTGSNEATTKALCDFVRKAVNLADNGEKEG